MPVSAKKTSQVTRASQRPVQKRATAAQAAKRPMCKLRMRVVMGETIAIGPGKVDLLEAVGEHRSISAAAKSMGMSYRRAWLLLDELNKSLKKPAISASAGGAHGGGAELTDMGRQLIALYRRIEEQALATCEGDIRCLEDLVGH